MRKINYLLLIGTFILLFLTTMSIFPQWFTDIDPYGKQYERLTYQDGKFKGSTPPIAPCEEFPLGTDALGRDMKSLIIYGCRTTLSMALIIAFGRLLIALPISLMAAYKNKFAVWLIKEFNIVFSAFPLIIICVFFGRTNITASLFVNNMTPVIIMLIILGWGKLANITTQKVSDILDQDFIEGEVSIGKNRLEIALQNILPHLIPNTIVMVFLEVALILVSLAQIGILRTIVSPTGFFIASGGLNTPLEFDWPSLFVFSYHLFDTGKTWLILYPALAFATSIIGFNLFGEGLRLEFDKKNSKVISTIKKIPAILSPVRFIHQIKNFKEYRSPVIKKTIAIVLILAILAIPNSQNLYKLDAQNVFSELEELKSEETNSIDFEINYANILSQKLKEYGVLSFNDIYLHKFIAEERKITDSSISISYDNKSIELEYKSDYRIQEYTPINGIYDLEIITPDQVENITKERAKELHDKVVGVDYRGFKLDKVARTIMSLEAEISPKGVLAIFPKDINLGEVEGKLSRFGTNLINIQSEKDEELLDISKGKINIKVQDGLREGVNVLGYIPGCDEKLKDEYIVIGCPVNYLQNSTKEYRTSEIGGSSLALEIAEAIQKYGIKPKRSIVFAFWGGDKEAGRGSLDFVKKYFKKTDKTAFYIDLKDLTNMQTDD
ncbi:MAG: ABC transporter permease subunit, partial [Lutisporaceae bacterium]